MNPFSISPFCLALLALLQQEPNKKSNYAVETRRECAIQALQVDLSQECNAWGRIGASLRQRYGTEQNR